MILKKVSSSYVDVETIQFKNLEELFELQQKTKDTYEYLFSWIDSQKSGYNMGRGVMQRANHSKNRDLHYKEKKKFNIPFNFPNWFLNYKAVSLFNKFYLK